MTRLDRAPEIIDLAAELGVGGSSPVDGILDFCRRRIDGWVAEAGSVAGIEALESLVVQRLQMVFEEIRTDEDFDRTHRGLRARARRNTYSPGCGPSSMTPTT